jgi:hypothetical protein
MIEAALLAAAGFLAVAVTLASVGPTGTAVSALALGLGMGGLASLTGGIDAFLTLSLLGALGFILILLGRRLPGLASAGWLLGRAPIVGRERVFDVRSLRLLAGVGGLMAARLLAGHLAAGTVSTQGPAFACLFAWEAGVIRVVTGRGPADLALGAFSAAIGTSAFMLLSSAHNSLGWAALITAVPAVPLVMLAWSAPWETGS